MVFDGICDGLGDGLGRRLRDLSSIADRLATRRMNAIFRGARAARFFRQLPGGRCALPTRAGASSSLPRLRGAGGRASICRLPGPHPTHVRVQPDRVKLIQRHGALRAGRGAAQRRTQQAEPAQEWDDVPHRPLSLSAGRRGGKKVPIFAERVVELTRNRLPRMLVAQKEPQRFAA